MERYKNYGGDSNIAGYEIGGDYIAVQFKQISKEGFNTYIYTNNVTGRDNVERMKELAVSGQGLNSFIRMHVKDFYERKEYRFNEFN